MNKVYGIFEDIKLLFHEQIIECSIYEDIFAKVYTNLNSITEQLKYYAQNAHDTGKKILEIASGDGGNYMIPLAQQGFEVHGVEISEDMIQQYENNVNRLPNKIKKRLKVFKEDIFQFKPNDKYDLIILPSTTICLLADDLDRTKELFCNIYEWLNDGGRFMFDYRSDQILSIPYESELVYKCDKKNKYLMLLQEFNNYINGRSIVNMYVDYYEDGVERKYIATSNKRIITDDLVNDLVLATKFLKHDEYKIGWKNEKIKLVVLEKREEIENE